MAIQQLNHDWDLLTDEATSNEDALRLQLRVLELAATNAEADRLIRPRFEEAPMGRLISAIVAQASRDGAKQIGLSFESEAVLVTFDGREAMTIPPTLNAPLRGMVRFIEGAGYAHIRPLFWKKARLPDELSVVWLEPDRLTLMLA